MSELPFSPFDADNHYYEHEDAFTRHVDRRMQKRAVEWVAERARPAEEARPAAHPVVAAGAGPPSDCPRAVAAVPPRAVAGAAAAPGPPRAAPGRCFVLFRGRRRGTRFP